MIVSNPDQIVFRWGRGTTWWSFFLVSCLGPSGFLLAEEPPPTNRPERLTMETPASNGWPRIAGDYFDATADPRIFALQFSTNLGDWRTAAVLLQTPFLFTDLRRESFPAGFYRLMTAPRTSTNDWANQLHFPYDPFFNPGECGSDRLRWAKFAIDLSEPHRVYFQDSSKFLLHVEFATNRLAAFRGLTAEQFNGLALYAGRQRIVLGAILAPLGTLGVPGGDEFAIQFSGFDPYPPDRVVEWIEIVKSAVASETSRAFYLPTFEQAPSAEQHRAYFAARSIEILSLARWNSGASVCYAPGWAVGRLQFITASAIEAAYADGRLSPGDILLTDGVPAEVPYVSGILSLVPATLNSHVAILAQSYGVPFAYVADPAERTRLLTLRGRTVAFRTGLRSADCQCQVIDVEGTLPPNVTNHIAVLKAPTRIEIPAKSPLGAFSAATAGLRPSDIRFFGGMAANFGLLRRVLPDHSPDAIAFSFDLWDEFLNQPFSGGVTLREAIRARLFPDRHPIELDFEYKKETPGHLSVKQIREVPSASGTNLLPAFALTSPAREFHPWGDVWAMHRLKSVWTLATRSTLFTSADLQSNVFSTARIELLDREHPRTLEGDLSNWPAASHQALLTNNRLQLSDRFLLGADSNRSEAMLTTLWPGFVSPGESPWLTLADAQLKYSVEHPTPVPVFTSQPSLISAEAVSLLPDATTGVGPTTRDLIVTNRSIRFYATFRSVQLVGARAESQEPDPRCFLIGSKNSFGYLGLKGETRLEGLLTEPLILRGRYSQTFSVRGRRGHETVHELICDPWLEPSLTAAQRTSLTAANIRALYYYHYRFGDETERFVVLGMDGQFRPVP